MAISQITSNSIATGAVSASDLADGSISAVKLATTGTANSSTYLRGDMAWSSLPSSGKVLQVVSTTKTNTQTVTGSSYVQISDLTATITPSSSSNRILVIVSVGFGGTTNCYPAFVLNRNGSDINLSSVGGTGERASFGGPSPSSEERYLQVAHNFFDTPNTTSATTYSIYVSPMRTNTQTVTINTAKNVGDNNQIKGTSTITLMEIAA